MSLPAAVVEDDTPSDGVHAGGGQPMVSKLSLGDAAAPPLNGVIVATAVWLAHVDGPLSTAPVSVPMSGVTNSTSPI